MKNYYEQGYKRGYEVRDSVQQSRSYNEIISVLKEKENEIILSLIEIKVEDKKYDKSGFFERSYVHYLTGELKNNSATTNVKDFKVRVDYYSQTKTIIESEEITIFESLVPKSVVKFKEKLNYPAKADSLRYEITRVTTE